MLDFALSFKLNPALRSNAREGGVDHLPHNNQRVAMSLALWWTIHSFLAMVSMCGMHVTILRPPTVFS